MEKGKVLIYKEGEALGLIKFDGDKYCRLYKKHLSNRYAKVAKGQTVTFELDICEETSEYIAKSVKVIK